ncbi:hypothetical protein WDZ92_51170, partial [Nostoc sp. NIES-2111]
GTIAVKRVGMTALMEWGCALLGHALCEDLPTFSDALRGAGAIGAIWLTLSLGIGLLMVVIKS